ncbi:MAG: DUF5615 family PIN-like protein [Segetibacter sp.]
MKILADEGVDKPIVEALRLNGFDVDYIVETFQGANDELILKMSYEQERVLLTQDKDFGELVFRLGQIHYGVILIRLQGVQPDEKAEIVTKLLLQYHDELVCTFTVIQPNAIRIRKRRKS